MVFLTGVAEKCNGYAGNVSDISGKSCNIFIRRLIGLDSRRASNFGVVPCKCSRKIPKNLLN